MKSSHSRIPTSHGFSFNDTLQNQSQVRSNNNCDKKHLHWIFSTYNPDECDTKRYREISGGSFSIYPDYSTELDHEPAWPRTRPNQPNNRPQCNAQWKSRIETLVHFEPSPSLRWHHLVYICITYFRFTRLFFLFEWCNGITDWKIIIDGGTPGGTSLYYLCATEKFQM